MTWLLLWIAALAVGYAIGRVRPVRSARHSVEMEVILGEHKHPAPLVIAFAVTHPIRTVSTLLHWNRKPAGKRSKPITVRGSHDR